MDGTACSIAERRLRPITHEARSSSGTGRPRSRQAAWMLCTISAVESNSVPSQSKTTRSKRRGRSGESDMSGNLSGQRGDERGAFGRQRRDELEAGAGGGMVEGELAGVQEHALEKPPPPRLAPRPAAGVG